MITKAQLVGISTHLKEQGYALPILSSSTHIWWTDARLNTIRMTNYPIYAPMPLADMIAWCTVIFGYQSDPAASETISYLMIKLILCGLKVPGNLEQHFFPDRAVNPDFMTTAVQDNIVERIIADSAPGVDVAARQTLWLRNPPTSNAGPIIDYIRQTANIHGEAIASSFMTYYFLAHFRLAVKDPESCLNLPEKIIKNFSSLYKKVLNRTIPVGFDQNGLRCIADFLSQKTPQTLGFFRVVIDSWNASVDAPNLRNQRGLLESAVINAIALNGLPVLSMAQRALMAIDSSLPEIWEATKGLNTDKGHYYAAATWVCYLIPEADRRNTLIANYAIAGAPPINQRYWRFARFFDDTTMMGLSGVGNDDSLYLYARIHDIVYTDKQIIPNYRILHTKYSSAELDCIADEVRSMFSSLDGVTGEVGEAVIRARAKGNGQPPAAVAAPAPAIRPVAVAPIAAPAPAAAVVPVAIAPPAAIPAVAAAVPVAPAIVAGAAVPPRDPAIPPVAADGMDEDGV